MNNSTILVFPLPFSPYIDINWFVFVFVLFKLNSISFNDLKFLKINDKVYLKFGNTTLEYNVVNIKSEKKNGKIKIKNKENQLILTTCDQVRKCNQLIIESDLITDKTSSN